MISKETLLKLIEAGESLKNNTCTCYYSFKGVLMHELVSSIDNGIGKCQSCVNIHYWDALVDELNETKESPEEEQFQYRSHYSEITECITTNKRMTHAVWLRPSKRENFIDKSNEFLDSVKLKMSIDVSDVLSKDFDKADRAIANLNDAVCALQSFVKKSTEMANEYSGEEPILVAWCSNADVAKSIASTNDQYVVKDVYNIGVEIV